MNVPFRELLLNKKHQVIIVGLTGGSVTAINTSDTPISGGNDFTTAGEVLRDLPISGQILETKDKAASLVKLTGRSAVSQFETRLAWSNSLKPNFQVDLTLYSEETFPSTNPNSPLNQYLRIKSGVLPSAQGKFFRAPLGYKIADGRGNSLAPTGTLSLEIGEWFRATKLVMTSENFSFSRETNSLGDPLFIQGSVTLEPYKAITYDEFQDYFRN